MMRVPRSSVIAALSLLAWTATASAECAWVLWQQDLSPVAMWHLDEAYPTVRECRDGLANAASSKKREGYDVPGDRAYWQTQQAITFGNVPPGEEKNPSYTRGYLRCLPDTVDPRGPKGK